MAIAKTALPSLMKQLIELAPIILFFVAYKLGDIYTATATLMAATCVQMLLIYMMERKLSLMHKVSLVLILAFGALTLGLNDDRFIKWKPTFMYFLMAAGLGIALWGFKKNVLHLLLGRQLNLLPSVWHNLCVAWIGYSVAMALINALAAHFLSTDAWMNFKLWGYVFPIAFFIAQGIYIARNQISE